MINPNYRLQEQLSYWLEEKLEWADRHGVPFEDALADAEERFLAKVDPYSKGIPCDATRP